MQKEAFLVDDLEGAKEENMMIPTPEDRIRMEQEALPDHISIHDDGEMLFAICRRCRNYIGRWADEYTRRCERKAFIEQHTDCPGLPMYDEDELRDDEPYFASDEDRCPPLGMQRAVLRPRRLF
jgi:hypothetical protein